MHHCVIQERANFYGNFVKYDDCRRFLPMIYLERIIYKIFINSGDSFSI